MSLPTNRQDGDVIENEDINALASAINDHEDRLTSVESDSDTSGTVTSVNGVEPDETGNVTIEAGGVSASIDPDDPTGLTLLLRIPSTPSVSLSLAASGFFVTATFTGASPDGLALTYTIDWGDGPTSATSPATHTYPSVLATRTVTVTVTDAEGNTATDEQTIQLAPPGVSPYGAEVLVDDPVVFFPMTEVSPVFPLPDYTGTTTLTVTNGTVTSEATPLGGGPRSFKFLGAEASLGQPAALDSMTTWTLEIIARQIIANRQGGFFSRSFIDGAMKRGVELSWARVAALRLPGSNPNADVNLVVSYPTNMTYPTHWVGTFDGAVMRLYANGVEIGQTPITGATTPGPVGTNWIMGLGLQYANLSGAAIYDHALSPTRIAAHAAAAGLGA